LRQYRVQTLEHVVVAKADDAMARPIEKHKTLARQFFTCNRNTYNVFESMHKKMTISLDEAVYDGLYRTIGKRRMSQFIEDLLRPHVLDTALDAGYQAMAADQAREAEAMEWIDGLNKDIADETR
jgi:hypothetical protein